MQLAAETSDMDIEQWLTENTTYCIRYKARLSLDACEINRKHSGEDLRCADCGGLFNQGDYMASSLPRLVRPENIDCPGQEASPDDGQNGEDQESELSMEAGPDDPGEDLSCLDDLEIELSDEQLEALYPGFHEEMNEICGSEASENYVVYHGDRRSRRKGQVLKVAVFMGRCRKCGGYMMNAPEKQFEIKDDSVYRCFTCGWRTSPGYEFNRNDRLLSENIKPTF